MVAVSCVLVSCVQVKQQAHDIHATVSFRAADKLENVTLLLFSSCLHEGNDSGVEPAINGL